MTRRSESFDRLFQFRQDAPEPGEHDDTGNGLPDFFQVQRGACPKAHIRPVSGELNVCRFDFREPFQGSLHPICSETTEHSRDLNRLSVRSGGGLARIRRRLYKKVFELEFHNPYDQASFLADWINVLTVSMG